MTFTSARHTETWTQRVLEAAQLREDVVASMDQRTYDEYVRDVKKADPFRFDAVDDTL